ncbi:MAG: anthranilate synthase component I family protein [Desulfovibrionaceae bacterium]|nr:anthranilate synthase component I family protein [Desulfovibrionaceae bacterium]
MSEPTVILQQKARWLPADMDTPISLFKAMVGSDPGILLESAEVDGRWGRYSLLLTDFILQISCDHGALALEVATQELKPLLKFQGQDFVPGLRKIIQSLKIEAPKDFAPLPPITRALYGYLGFGLAGLFNAKLSQVMPKEEAQATLVLPATTLVFDHLYNRLTKITLYEPKNADTKAQNNSSLDCQPQEITTEPDGLGYQKMVREIKAKLVAGEAIQVVPSVRFSCPFGGDSFELYRRMRRFNASPYMFYMHFKDFTLFGSSPEVMVGVTEGKLKLSPIAGTRRRGVDEREDQFLASELLHDPKERAEHVMLVDLGRNDLGRIAKAGSVKVERYMEIERFSHVMHLTSRVTAKLREGLDGLDVLAATFPAGTVSGAPKIRALEIIRELEAHPRGPYAGCIGWLGLDKDRVDLDFGITIRSMWQKENRLYWQAGGGIVHDSDPELEWKEVCNKSAIMRLVLSGGEEKYVSAHR